MTPMTLTAASRYPRTCCNGHTIRGPEGEEPSDGSCTECRRGRKLRQRARERGENVPPHVSRRTPLEKIAARIEIDTETECWVWTGASNVRGYMATGEEVVAGGKVFDSAAGKYRRVQRVAALAWCRGIDHLVDPETGDWRPCVVVKLTCGNRRCCNPSHMRPMWEHESKQGRWALGSQPTCSRGHSLHGPGARLKGVAPGSRGACRYCGLITSHRAVRAGDKDAEQRVEQAKLERFMANAIHDVRVLDAVTEDDEELADLLR